MPATGEDLMYAVARDVTDRHDQDDVLLESEAGFDLLAQALARQSEVTRGQLQLLDVASDAVVVRGMNGRIAFWNRAAERLYGWKREEVLGGFTETFLDTKFPVPFEGPGGPAERGAMGGRARPRHAGRVPRHRGQPVGRAPRCTNRSSVASSLPR